MVRAQVALLTELLGAEWLASNRGRAHPACDRLALCEHLLAHGGGLRLPQDKPCFAELAELFLDNLLLVFCTGGDPDRFALGNFANYGDPAVAARIRAVVRDPQQFADLLVEFAAAGWHLTKGHTAVANETGGADLLITIPELELPLLLECKRLRAATQSKRIAELVKNANLQIKQRAVDAYGVAVLDVSSHAPPPEVFSDAIPDVVSMLAEIARRSMASRNRSVSGVLLLWEDYDVHEDLSHRRAWVAFRRRSLLLRHSAPRWPLPEDQSFIEVGNTVEFGVRLTPTA